MALLSTAVKIAVKQWRRVPSNKCRSIHSVKDRFSTSTGHDFGHEIGYTDVADLLSTPERDFLVKKNGQKVAISSLRGKLVGLYFCDNITHPPRIQAIKKVYEEAKSRGYDFEIVQITFHYRCSNGKHLGIDPIVRQCREDISWLTLPFMDPTDPTCRKLQRIFECVDDDHDRETYWVGDSLVLIYPEVDDSSGVLFDFSGAEILKRWGIEGYPFTRQSLYKVEYELQKREVTLRSLFPPGECLLRRPRGHGFDIVDGFSHLWWKRVLVLFAPHSARGPESAHKFIRMVKSAYRAQLKDNVAEESKFEVVCVSTDSTESEFDEFTKDMPWLVRPFSHSSLLSEVFKNYAGTPAAAAFNEEGKLIAKECGLDEKRKGVKPRFPFISQDLEKFVRGEVDILCDDVAYNRNGF